MTQENRNSSEPLGWSTKWWLLPQKLGWDWMQETTEWLFEQASNMYSWASYAWRAPHSVSLPPSPIPWLFLLQHGNQASLLLELCFRRKIWLPTSNVLLKWKTAIPEWVIGLLSLPKLKLSYTMTTSLKTNSFTVTTNIKSLSFKSNFIINTKTDDRGDWHISLREKHHSFYPPKPRTAKGTKLWRSVTHHPNAS